MAPFYVSALSKRITIVSVLLFLFLSCENAQKTHSIKTFYFPYETLENGQVYEYSDETTGEVQIYWFYKMEIDSAGNSYLVSNQYAPDFSKIQSVNERILPSGVRMADHRFYTIDSLNNYQVHVSEVQDGVMYPWEAILDSNLTYRFKISYQEPYDKTVNTTLTRDRYFSGYTTFNWKNEEVKAIRFIGKEFIELEANDGGNWTQKVEQPLVEVYAEGLGLVRSERKDSNGQIMASRLSAIYSVQEFEAMKKSE